jgi:hypothetical protein
MEAFPFVACHRRSIEEASFVFSTRVSNGRFKIQYFLESPPTASHRPTISRPQPVNVTISLISRLKLLSAQIKELSRD